MITIGDIEFERNPDVVSYPHNYEKIAADIKAGVLPEIGAYRSLILNDLWFILYFVMGMKNANHPFAVKMCKEVQQGPVSGTLDVWARGHLKSSIITIAETLQFELGNPEKCTGILAYARPVAKSFLRSIKTLCEQSDFLKHCFPDVLWSNPEAQSPKWSEDDGLIFKRKSASRPQSSIEAWGLIEGMPTGRHFERLVFDDIETDDIKDNVEIQEKVFGKFEMAGNLGTGQADDIRRVIGTYYSNFGPIKKIEDMAYQDGRKVYHLRKVPGSDDGTMDGKPVFMSQESWDMAKTTSTFYSQQLCDPTPRGERRLNSEYLKDIDHQFIPRDIARVMVIDPAGDGGGKDRDSWAIHVVGVENKTDNNGMPNVYILNSMISPMTNSEAIDIIVRMYLSDFILKLGIEKKDSTILIDEYVVKALKEKGRHLSVDAGNLILLRPAGRNKKERISKALEWPLNNGKLFMSKNIPSTYRERIRSEMDKYPFGHDDALDALSYLYDIIKDCKLSSPFNNSKPIKYAELGVI